MLTYTVVILGAVLGVGPASSGADEAAGLRERVDALETRIARLEATKQPDHSLTVRRATEIRGLVAAILADADRRAAELDQSLTGGWDKHFFVRSEDGSFRMEALGVVQTRFMYNHRNNSGGDDDRWGFDTSRVRLKVRGHVVDPSWHFFVQAELAQSPGLRDAHIRKYLGGGWYLRAGLFKLPFTREKLVTFTRTLAVDRSLVDQQYNVGRGTGLELDYMGKQWRFRANVNNGARSTRAAALSTGTDFAFAARAETLFFGGNWTQFSEYRGLRAVRAGGLFGIAGFYQNNDSSAAERYAVTTDVTVEWERAAVFASFIWNHVDPGGAGSESMSQLGAVIQGGVHFADNWEAFARYEWSDLDTAGAAELGVMTVGVVRYYNGNSLKWTTDVGVGLNPVASEFAAPALGWQADAPGENGQVVVRSQLQLLF